MELIQEPTSSFRPGGISQHERVADGKDEWLTPREIIDSLGPFDLDPCSPVHRPWPTASRHFTIETNGLAQLWAGRVWMNPPYGSETERWMNRLADHGNGIALIFARTETETWFVHIWTKAHAVFFFKGRIAFCHVDGHKARTSAGAPSALIAYGQSNVTAIQNSGLQGKLIALKNSLDPAPQ